MNLYDFYKTLNQKLLEDFKKVINKDIDDATPVKLKRRYVDKLNKWIENAKDDVPELNANGIRFTVSVTRFQPNTYVIRTVYGVNKMMTLTKYDSKKNEFTQTITNEGTLKPVIDI